MIYPREGGKSMKIQILGPGCARCKQLAEATDQAARELGLDYELVKVTELNEIMSFGVMMTPGLVVDGVVKSVGKVPSAEQLKTMLKS
jgi:small redox-active disulfide protein 2